MTSPLCRHSLRASPPEAVCTVGAGPSAAPSFQSCLTAAVAGPERFWGDLLLRCPGRASGLSSPAAVRTAIWNLAGPYRPPGDQARSPPAPSRGDPYFGEGV